MKANSPTKKAWKNLADADFEDLVFSLLNREGFMNCSWSDREDDGGRDIVCYRFTVDGPPELFQKYVVLCKHDKTSIGKHKLIKDLEEVKEHDPYCVVIAANTAVSNYKKRMIGDLEKEEENDFKIQLWERDDLIGLVEEYQDLRLHYLGVEIDDIFKVFSIRNVFARHGIEDLSDELNELLKHMFIRCIQDSTAAANSMLLASYMETEKDLIHTMLAGNRRLLEGMTQFLEGAVSSLPKVDFTEVGVEPTDGFVKTLILGNKLSKVLQRPCLDERLLLYALFKITSSNTVHLLVEKFPPDAVESMELAMFCLFDIVEQDNLKRFFAECARKMDLAMSEEEKIIGYDLDSGEFEFSLGETADDGAALEEDEACAVPGGGRAESRADDVDDWDELRIEYILDDGRREREDPDAERSPLDGAAFDEGLGSGVEEAPVDARRSPTRKRPRFTGLLTYEYDMALDHWFSRTLSYLLSHYKRLSDIFIFPEKPLQIRSDGKVHSVELDTASTSFTYYQAEAIACMLLNKAVVKGLLTHHSGQRSISFTYQMKGHQSFRVTVTPHAMGAALAFRKSYPPLWSGENLFFNDPLLSSLMDFDDGIVIVAGKPGSGKTTFMNAMINEVNQKSFATVVTLEDPIETFHSPICSSILQLQKGIHFSDVEEAAELSARSCADLIVIDELRDAASCRACLDSARSGLTSAASITARSCREAWERILHLCDAKQDPSVRSFLAGNLKRIICLTLEPREGGKLQMSFEVIDLAAEMERGGAGLPSGAAPDGSAEKESARMEERIEAAFNRRTVKTAGVDGPTASP